MNAVPGYGKILTLGSAYTENALVGEVVIQEKVDGSLFAFGINQEEAILMRSKGAVLRWEDYADMFKEAVEFIRLDEVWEKLRFHVPTDTYFYCEYLQKPKHNTLKYEKIPDNHLVLFDVVERGKYVDRKRLEKLAEIFDIDVIPELARGQVTVDAIKELLTTQSYLGGEIIEGVVIKNYSQTILLGGQVFPLFTKYVREAFKERHAADWKVRSPKGALQEFVDGFKTEARWQKAIVHAREKGLLTQSPKDIGMLMSLVKEDIKIEETDNIKNHLYKCFIDDILRKSSSGLPEWYKAQLLNNLNYAKGNIN